MEQFFVIITAGGQGTRMGSAVPKQFLELEGKPILRITIEKFMEAMPGIRIITVLPEDHQRRLHSRIQPELAVTVGVGHRPPIVETRLRVADPQGRD